MITRSMISGAIRLLNANATPNRRGWLFNLLRAEHSERDANKALKDLDSFPEWAAGAALDAVAAAPEADAPMVAKKKKRSFK